MSRRPLYVLLLLCATFLVWGTSLWNGFVWDDRILIQKNEVTISRLSLPTAFLSDFWATDTESGSSNYYRPLVTLSYMVDYWLYGLNPAGFHATNILIHAAGVVSLFYLLTLLGLSSAMAGLAAAVWAVHPGVAESVAWISGRTDSLATVFMLLSVIMALRGAQEKKERHLWAFSSAGLFGAGLLSKESAFITPLITLIFLNFGKNGAKIRPALLWSSIVVCVGWLLLRWSVLARPVGTEVGDGVSLNIGILSLLHTWGGLVWPPVFRIEYGASLTSQALIGGAFLGALMLLWMGFVLGAKLGPRPVRYLYVAALVAFIPSVMAVFLKSMIGARLVYTSSAFALAGVGIGLRLDERGASARRVFGCVLVVLAVITTQRARLWRSDITLFSAALQDADPSTRNHLNLGIALYDNGELHGALEHLSTDMERAALDQRHYMLALLYTAVQCESLAEGHLVKSLEFNPDNFSASYNLAGLFATQGRHEEARARLVAIAARDAFARERAVAQIEVLKRLTNIPPRAPNNSTWCTDPRAWQELLASAISLNRLAGEHLKAGQLELAEPLIKAALRVDPWFVAGRLNLAQLYLRKGEKERARALLQSILNTNPGEERAGRMLAALNAGPPTGE
jgi:protein O-mannosyl-transferase